MTTVESDPSIVGLFCLLPTPEPGSGANVFRTRLIPHCEHHRLGKDSDGQS